MNIDNFFIEENEIELAKEACSSINDPIIRSRCVANTLAANIAQKYFTDYDVDIESCLHRIPQFSSNIDIADVYVNGYCIDVRLYHDNEAIKIPKYNYEVGLLPVAHLAIKIDTEFTSATVMGFVTPEMVSTLDSDEDYFYTSEDLLVSFYDVEPLLNSTLEENIPENFEELTYNYLDGNPQDIGAFYKALLSSKDSRVYLLNVAKAQTVLEAVLVSQDENTDNNIDTEDSIASASEDLEIVDDTLDLVDFGSDDSITLDETSSEFEDLEADFVTNESIDELESINTELDLNTGVLDEELHSDNFDTIELGEEFSTSTTPSLNSIENVEEDFEISIEENDEDDIIVIEDENIQDNSDEIEEDYIDKIDSQESSETDSNSEIYDEITEVKTVDTDNLENDDIVDLENDPDENIVANDVDESIEINDSEVNEENASGVVDDEIHTNSEEESDLDTLFNRNNNTNEDETNEYKEEPLPRKNSKALPLIGALVISLALGYYGYTKFTNTATEPEIDNTPASTLPEVVIQQEEAIQGEKPSTTKAPAQKKEELLMPVETVENIKTTKPTNEGIAVSLPAIEQSLGASIDVANLTVKWEVPSAYLTNNTANKYFTKIGKIIQLNLKTEMLLLNKSPITNKIMVELEFNKNNNKFNVKKVTTSSGEKVIDDLIVKTVKGALDLNLKMNLEVFNNLPGNPVLIIRL